MSAAGDAEFATMGEYVSRMKLTEVRVFSIDVDMPRIEMFRYPRNPKTTIEGFAMYEGVEVTFKLSFCSVGLPIQTNGNELEIKP